METEYLIDCNRPALKELFYTYIAAAPNQHVNYNQFFKFCCKVKLYPELATSSELKRIVSNAVKKNLNEEKLVEISYLAFEKILKGLAEHCFPNGNSVKLLISYIRNPCSTTFQVFLTTVAPLHISHDNISPVNNPSKQTSIIRPKNFSVRHRKVLNNSTSQKITLSRAEVISSSREQTMSSSKITQINSPRLKLINIKQKIQEEKKLKNIKEMLIRFKNTQENLKNAKFYKKTILNFMEKFIEMKMRTVKDI